MQLMRVVNVASFYSLTVLLHAVDACSKRSIILFINCIITCSASNVPAARVFVQQRGRGLLRVRRSSWPQFVPSLSTSIHMHICLYGIKGTCMCSWYIMTLMCNIGAICSHYICSLQRFVWWWWCPSFLNRSSIANAFRKYFALRLNYIPFTCTYIDEVCCWYPYRRAWLFVIGFTVSSPL
jgi:hypothetical protein